jgi:hypothetical protein
MMINSRRVEEGMRVISSDDRCLGVVTRIEAGAALRVLSVAGGHGYASEIPASWIAEVGKCVYLDKSSTFIVGNRHTPRNARRLAS